MLMEARAVITKNRMPEVEANAWDFVQRVGIFGYLEISAELSISPRAVPGMVKAWMEEGRVRVKHGGSGNTRKMFELMPEYREPKDRTSLVAQQLWTAMRGLKKFTPTDLAGHCRADLRVEVSEASSYAQALLRAGYLRVLRTAVPEEGRDAMYQLVTNTGPRAPREKRVVAVWDPNDGAYAFVSGVGRVERAK